MIKLCKYGHVKTQRPSGVWVCKPCHAALSLVWIAKQHPLYVLYRNMLRRCYDPNDKSYKNWGGRKTNPIRVCDKWLGVRGFDNFCEDMFPTWVKGLSIERKDVNGNYCKENCEWIPFVDQGKNRRNSISKRVVTSENSLIYYPYGVLITLKEFAEKTGLPLLIAKFRFAYCADADWILNGENDGRDHKYGDHYYSVREISLMTGIKYALLLNRLKEQNWSVEKAIGGFCYKSNPKLKIDDPYLNNLIVDYFGTNLNLVELTHVTKIPLIVLKFRCTFSFELTWLIDNDFRDRSYMLSDHTYSVGELSLISGLPARILTKRIRTEGWSVERAMSTPVRPISRS